MDYRIAGLDPRPFSPFFEMDGRELARRRAVLRVVDDKPGAPCRVTLEDAEPGEQVLLVNFEHLPADSPYRASHAIYVRRSATAARVFVNEVPPALASRLLSVRAFDHAGFMAHADVVEGPGLPALARRFLADPAVAFLHAHYARAGCFAARIDRGQDAI